MFGLFGKKKKKAELLSHIGFSRQAAFEQLAAQLKDAPKPVLVFYYFEETRTAFQNLLNKLQVKFTEVSAEPHANEVCFVNAAKFNSNSFRLNNIPQVFCIDHYPKYSTFSQLSEGLAEINPEIKLHVYGGMDEPIFKVFGGDKMREMMLKMGMKETELVEHSMVSKALERAQEKIDKKVTTDLKSSSAADWFKKNLPEESN